jgi:hypothetical protein
MRAVVSARGVVITVRSGVARRRRRMGANVSESQVISLSSGMVKLDSQAMASTDSYLVLLSASGESTCCDCDDEPDPDPGVFP